MAEQMYVCYDHPPVAEYKGIKQVALTFRFSVMWKALRRWRDQTRAGTVQPRPAYRQCR